MKSTSALAFSVAAVAGLLAGWVLARHHLERHQADLFSPQPLRRLAALNYLGGQGGVETVRLIRDYLGWEPQGTLRRRAERLAHRLERELA